MATVTKTELVTKERDVLVSDISGTPIPYFHEGLTRNCVTVSCWCQGGWIAGHHAKVGRSEDRIRKLDVTPEECNDLIQEIDEAIRRVRLKHRSRIIGGAQ